MIVEYFDNNGDAIDSSDDRAILVYRVDYDASVDLLRWAYGRLALYGIGKMETALKMDEIKLMIEQHERYLPLRSQSETEGYANGG